MIMFTLKHDDYSLELLRVNSPETSVVHQTRHHIAILFPAIGEHYLFGGEPGQST